MTKIPTNMCALALPLIFAAGSALASDAKTYSGTTCRAPEAAQRLSYARSYNKSNATVAFNCPAVKDDHSLNWLRGHVYVVDNHYSSDVKCDLISSPNQGAVNARWFSFSYSKAGSDPSPQKLTFGNVYTHGDASNWLLCWLPGVYSGNESAVVAYTVDEF